MIPEMRELPRFHLGEQLEDAKETTVKYDGTSTKRHHFGEVQIATRTECFTVGIKEMSCGDADYYVEVIK